MIILQNIKNLDLLSVGITIITIGILGFIIFFNNRSSITNRSFLFFSLATVFWSIVNYSQYHINIPIVSFWNLRVVVFFAVWHAFSFFQLCYVFPDTSFKFSKFYKFLLIPIVVITSLLTLTPLVFHSISELSPTGEIAKVSNGPGIGIFALVVIGLISSGLFQLIKKMKKANGIQRVQLTSVFLGTSITFILLLTFNFILPTFFDNPRFIPLGAVFTFPFVAFTAYAIIKHHLFNVKVIATEITVFLLVLVLVIQFVNAQGLNQELASGFILVSALTIGLFLIQSVIKEVKQREQIGTLNVQLQRSIEELRKVDEVKTEFVSLASHQLRTPLTAIKGYVDMLRNGDFGALNGEQKEVSDKVFISSQRMVELIDDLLDVSKLEKEGGFSYQFQVGNPEEVFKAVVEEFQKPAREEGLALSFVSHIGSDAKIKFDPEKLKEAIGNIISNSLKYTIEGGVSISLTQSTDMIVLTIRDTGVGIDADDIPKIFQKFFRAKAVARLTTEGTGLGLYFTRAVIEDHGGHVWVESEGVGKGSAFIVKLPKIDETMKPLAGGEVKSKETEANKGTQVTANAKPTEQKSE